jgi:preprotein translocase subunit SecG
MTTLFLILVIIASIVLSLIVLVQNPKGGGLASSIGGFSNQFMGVKQTTDVLEKGTWIFAAIIGVLCLTASLFINSSSTGSKGNNRLNDVGGAVPTAPAPAPTVPNPGTTVPVTTNPDTPK